MRVFGFCSLLLIFSNISKVLIVVIIRAVEMWKTYVIACQPLEFFLNRSCRPSTLPQHQLSLLLSFHRVAPLFGNLSVMFQSSFRRTRVRYISLMSPRSASSSSRSSRFSFIFSSTWSPRHYGGVVAVELLADVVERQVEHLRTGIWLSGARR